MTRFFVWLWREPLEVVLCGLIATMATIIMGQVVARYIFEAPLSWSEELARFLLMWLSMLSAAYAFKLKAHFALIFVVQNVPVKLRRLLQLLVFLAASGFLGLFVVMSVIFVRGVEGHIAPALRIPMEIPYSASIVGGLLMLYYVVKGFWHEVRGGLWNSS
jgi:TRAP-type C4-dicarboxylate transport system permease small subunit